MSNLQRIHAEARSETYDGKLDWGHVGFDDLRQWADSRPAPGINLDELDVASVMMLFEEWVKADLGTAWGQTPTPS